MILKPIFENVNFLADEYQLEQEHFNIIKEMVNISYMYSKTGIPDILTEGTQDICKSIVRFFESMIRRIKEFFKKILMIINSNIMELDKFCNKYSEELKKLDPKSGLEFTGFKYTIADEPDLEVFKKAVNEYNGMLSSIGNAKLADLKNEHIDFLSDANLNKLRANVLCVSGEINEDDFKDRVREHFRDGKLNAEEVFTIDKELISQICNSSARLVKARDQAIKSRDELMNLLTKTKDFFDGKFDLMYKNQDKFIRTKTASIGDNNKLDTKNGEEFQYNDDISKKLDELMRYIYDKAKVIGNMEMLVLNEKVQALKDNIVQNRQILKKALSNPDKGGDN